MQKTIKDIVGLKNREKIAMLTAYDFPTAAVLDQAGIDILLVGDSLGNVILGHSNTLSVTLADMIHHSKAVAKAAQSALVIADMPFGSYQASPEDALRSACRLIAEGHAAGVKLEGGVAVSSAVEKLVHSGIPVMGHIGLTPQSIHQLGGFFIQGKSETESARILADAKALESAGVFSIVLECVEPKLAREITQTVSVPTIGIGSGEDCDGQVLVIHDLLGLTMGKIPKFVKPLADLKSVIHESVVQYIRNTKKS